MSTPTLQQRLQSARSQMEDFEKLRKEAFQPAPAMPQAGAPPMDPNMQQGGPPMDPSMQGGPPMDPQQQAMMEQQMMAQQGGAPPMDPSMQQGPPPVPPEQLEEMMTLMEQMGQGLTQAMERIDGLESQLQELGPQVEEITSTLQSAMQGAAQEPQPAGGW